MEANNSIFPKARFVIPLVLFGLFGLHGILYMTSNFLGENLYWLTSYSLDLLFLVMIIAFLRKKQIALHEAKMSGSVFLKTGFLMFLSLVFAIGTVSFASLLLPDLYDDPEQELVKLEPFYLAIAGFLSIVILAPAWEELIFRGLILNRWREKWSIGTAIILSSIVFALLHPLDPIGAFVFSMILAIQYLRTKNIFVAIVGHSFYNLLLYVFFISGHIAGLGQEPLEIPTNSEIIIFGSICLVLSLPVLTYWLKKNWPKSIE